MSQRNDEPKIGSLSSGTPRAVIQYRCVVLEDHGLDPDLASDMQGRFRSDIRREVAELAKERGVEPPQPQPEPDITDPGELARKHGRRRY